MSLRESLTHILWAASYFVANGINNWLPTLYKTVYHLPLQEALRLASITNVLSVCAVFTCAMLVDKVGRRRGLLLLARVVTGAQSVWSVAILASAAYAVIGQSQNQSDSRKGVVRLEIRLHAAALTFQ